MASEISKSLPLIEVIGSQEVLVLLLKAGKGSNKAQKMRDLIVGTDLTFNVGSVSRDKTR